MDQDEIWIITAQEAKEIAMAMYSRMCLDVRHEISLVGKIEVHENDTIRMGAVSNAFEFASNVQDAACPWLPRLTHC